MKHLKTFEKFNLNEGIGTVLLYVLIGVAWFKIMRDVIKRKKIFRGLEKNQIKILDNFIESFKDKKALIGDIIDNENQAQIVYEYGGSDNIVVFNIDKNQKTLTFRWRFTIPIFPFVQQYHDDQITVLLDDSSYQKVIDMFNKLKSEEFEEDTTKHKLEQ
jgi:hypothetical protein